MNFLITSPLEQFEILPLFSIFGIFTLTNQFLFLALLLFFIVTSFFASLKPSTNTLYIIPTRWQSIIELIYLLILSMVNDTIGGKKGEPFFSFSVYYFYFCCWYEFNRFNSL